MYILKQIRQYIDRLSYDDKPQETIPLSNIEVDEIVYNHCTHSVDFAVPSKPELFGHEVWKTEFAECIRTNRVECKTSLFVTERAIDPFYLFESGQLEITKREFGAELFVGLRLNITTDVTQLKITHEWDCWAKLKRLLRVTKWFPIKSKTAVVDCKVLYPYLKINLPHNKHTVKFNLI